MRQKGTLERHKRVSKRWSLRPEITGDRGKRLGRAINLFDLGQSYAWYCFSSPSRDPSIVLTCRFRSARRSLVR
jgi:hypothetical protein